MEETSKVMGIRVGVESNSNKRPLELRKFTMNKAPSRLPLGSAGSFQVRKKPYLMSTSTSGAIKNCEDQQHLDINPKSTTSNTPLLEVELNEDHKFKVENATPDYKIPSSCNGSDAISEADNDNIRSSDDQESEKMQVINGVQFGLGRTKIGPNMEPRKLKRIISNRVSAQKSRMKKLQYVSEMENRVKTLEAQIAMLSPQVSLYKNQNHLLQMEKKSLSQQMSACANSRLLKNVEIEKNKAEVNRLKQLQFKQQQHHFEKQARLLNWLPAKPVQGLLDQIANSGLHQSGLEHYSNQELGDKSPTQLNNILINQMNMTQQQDQDAQKIGQAIWTADDLPAAPGCSCELNQNINMVPNLLCSNQSTGSTGLHQPIDNLGPVDHHENMLSFNSTTPTAFKYSSDPHYCFV